MQLIARIKSVLPRKWSMNTAVKLGLWVGVALIVLQSLAAIPTLWSKESHLMNHASSLGRTHVETWLQRNPQSSLHRVPLATSMQGMRFRAPGSDANLAVIGNATWDKFRRTGSNAVRREGQTLLATWSIEHAGRPVSVDAQINIRELVVTSRWHALAHLLSVLITSLLGGLAAWFLARKSVLTD